MARESEPGALSLQRMVAAHKNISAYGSQRTYARLTTEQQGGAGDLLRRRTRGAPPRSSGHRQLQVLRTPPDTLDQTRAAENKDVL